jgi:hypothetical protein
MLIFAHVSSMKTKFVGEIDFLLRNAPLSTFLAPTGVEGEFGH